MNTTNTPETLPSDPEQIRRMVREKYALIADQPLADNLASCCGATAPCTPAADGTTYTVFAQPYETLEGYAPQADLGLGCGLPTQFARIQPGDTVLDLGSGAGNDCFVARAAIGPTGQVIGVDFTPEMIARARQNAQTLGYENVTFRLGEIEHLPLTSQSVDVVVSNCVLNLVPNKARAFAEALRVLKPGGRLCVSDVVRRGDLPAPLLEAAELYAGCVSGAHELDAYLAMAAQAGFVGLEVAQLRPITLPAETLAHYLDEQGQADFAQGQTGIFSITLVAYRPESMACAPGSGCC